MKKPNLIERQESLATALSSFYPNDTTPFWYEFDNTNRLILWVSPISFVIYFSDIHNERYNLFINGPGTKKVSKCGISILTDPSMVAFYIKSLIHLHFSV